MNFFKKDSNTRNPFTFAAMSYFHRNNRIVQPIRRLSAKSVEIAGKVWRNIDIRKPETWLSTFVNLLLRIGTLLLIITLLALLWRIFKNEGFIIEPFSMPKNCEENGYTGEVMARQMLDAYQEIKETGHSVKDDNINAEGPDNSELNVAVMGFGISLRSIAFRLRELMGRPNPVVRGELVKSDTIFVLTIRMTGHPAVKITEKAGANMEDVLQKMLQQAGEVVLGKTDPYRLALYYIRRKSFDNASKVLYQMMEDRPTERHWAIFGQGVLADALGDNGSAAGYFKSAIAIQPDFSIAYQRAAECCRKLNKPDDAKKYYLQAVALNPGDSTTWNGLGYLFNDQKDYKASDKAFQKVITLTPNNPYWLLNWVECLAGRNEKDRAVVLLEACVKSRKDSCSIYWLSGYINRLKGNDDVALKEITHALEFEPENTFLAQSIARELFRQGDYRGVIHYSAKMYPIFIDGNEERIQSIWNYAAMAYNIVGKPDSAIHWVNKSIAVNPVVGYPYSTMAETYGFEGNRDQFYFWLEKAFIQGFRKGNIDPGQEPYKRFEKEKRYQDLLAKYQ